MTPEALGQAQSIAAQVMANVTPDQLELSTPCDAWNVGQLIDHLVGAQHWAKAAMTGIEQTDTGEGASQGDFNATFSEAAAANLAEFQAEGALAKTVNPGFGDMPAGALMGLAMTDTFTHAWDLATATGQNNDLDAEMAGQLLEASRQSIQDAFRSEGGEIFGLEQQAPEGANAATQLAAFLGRTV